MNQKKQTQIARLAKQKKMLEPLKPYLHYGYCKEIAQKLQKPINRVYNVVRGLVFDIEIISEIKKIAQKNFKNDCILNQQIKK